MRTTQPHPKHPVATRAMMPALLAAALGCVLLMPTGCGSSPGGQRDEPAFNANADVSDPRFGIFVPDRVDAVLGERLVIPVELAGDFRPEDVGRARLDDGRYIPTEVQWGISVEHSDERAWIGNTKTWSAVPADDPAAGVGTGVWLLLLDPPVDAVGQGLWLAGRRTPINWLPDPRETARRVPSNAWSSPLPTSARITGSLQRLLEPARQDPMSRWRVRLLSGELAPPQAQRVVDANGSVRRPIDFRVSRADDAYPNATVEAVARLRESRWLTGLARLYEADSELNLRVRRRLCAAVDFGDGSLAPMWSSDSDSVDRLLSDLIDQTLTPRERARRAKLWLDQQPAGVAWVLSDAGRKTIRGTPVTTVGLLNATWEPLLASLEAWSASDGLELEPLAPLSVTIAEVESRPEGAARAAALATIDGNEFALLASAADGRAKPPGYRIEPFFDHLTMNDLFEGRQTRARTDATLGQLYKDHLDRWVLYFECRTDRRTPGDDDSLALSFGPVGSSLDTLVIASADGTSSIGRAGADPRLEQAEVEAEIGRYPGGWSLRLVVPRSCIEDGRELRLGVVRTDDQRVRTAWPRAMLPWQQTPARGAIDLATWDD